MLGLLINAFDLSSSLAVIKRPHPDEKGWSKPEMNQLGFSLALSAARLNHRITENEISNMTGNTTM